MILETGRIEVSKAAKATDYYMYDRHCCGDLFFAFQKSENELWGNPKINENESVDLTFVELYDNDPGMRVFGINLNAEQLKTLIEKANDALKFIELNSFKS
jgi:hypothetical protein